MIPAVNDEEARQIQRRTEDEGKYIPHSNIDRQLRQESHSNGGQSIGVHRDNCSPGELRNTFGVREALIGKILSQLVMDFRVQVAAKKEEIHILESKILEFESVLENLEQHE